MTDTQPQIEDEPQTHRFVHRDSGAEAELIYRADPGRLILVHTEVPRELGGRGLAGALVEAALERARRTGEVIVPWCPYARSWLEKHPDRSTGVSIDWDARPPRG